MKITISAPGKLMLFGEHAVVYNRPCIVTAVDPRMFVTLEKTESGMFEMIAPDVNIKGYKKPISEMGTGEIPKSAKFVEIAVKNAIEKKKLKLSGLKIATRSEFSSQFGFGSSSASTVCVVKGLAELFRLKISDKELFDISYKTVLDIQGKGSGFDIAAAVWGGTLYFKKGGTVIQPISLNELPLIVGYTGVKADTVTLVNQVAGQLENDTDRINALFNSIGYIVDEAKNALKKKNWQKVGELMNDNQRRLEVIQVSSPELDKLITASLDAGAYGAKLSGAGGGDCMIALAPDDRIKAVEKAIGRARGTVIPVTMCAKGVRIEL